MHLQVVLFNHQTRPDEVEQLVLANHTLAPFDQREQQVEGTRSESGLLTVNQQLALGGANFDAAEAITPGHRGSLPTNNVIQPNA